jgi:hypothetical protein
MLERYNPMLHAIKEFCPTAHIGGGAARDTLLERPIKDIDLFVSNDAADAAAKRLRSQFGFVKVGEWMQYEGFSDPAVIRVAKFEKADEDIPVCLIGLNRARGMEENLSRFDFGVCMAAWDGNKVYVAPEYIADIEAKAFTMHRADNQAQFDYSMSRFNKMTADRYAGWQLAVPAEFKEFAREHAFRETHYHDYDSGVWMRRCRDLSPQQLKPKAR